MLRKFIVLIPKGTPGDFCEIGLLEVILKLSERVLNEKLSKNEVHDYLRGFRVKRGSGKGIMEVKLVQQFACQEQAPLYCIFLDPKKTYL